MSPARQRGIALMLVIWVLTLLTLIAVSLTASQRTENALTESHVVTARFHALAEAAIAYTALDFMVESHQVQDGSDEAESTWVPDGVPRTWQFDGVDLKVAVFNEASRLNLNLAGSQALASLLEVLGVEQGEAGTLADAILDWRDEDDAALLNGAEDRDYKEAGRAIGAKDAKLDSVEELRQVLGMSEGLYQRLLPEVTVDGDSATPEGSFASPAVLAATTGISLEEAVEQVAERNAREEAGADAQRGRDRGGPLYRVQVTQREPDGGGRRMEALIQLTPGQQPPYQVLWRQYGWSLRDPVYGEPDEAAEAGVEP